jgi:hypothetical protein
MTERIHSLPNLPRSSSQTLLKPFDILDCAIPLIVLTGASLCLLIDPVGLYLYVGLLSIGFIGGYLIARWWIQGLAHFSSLQLVEALARQRLQSLSTVELGRTIEEVQVKPVRSLVLLFFC